MTYQHPLTTAQDPTALPPFSAKLRAHGETRRVRLPRDITWSDFDQQIRSTFPHLTDPHVHYTVTYHDDDEDEISLSTTEELREALATNEQLCNPKCLTFAIVSDDMSDSDSASIASWRASVVAGPLLVPADETDAMDVDSPIKPAVTVRPEDVPLPPSPPMSPAPLKTTSCPKAAQTSASASAPKVTININHPIATGNDIFRAAMDAMDEDDEDSTCQPPARPSTPAVGPSTKQDNVIRIHISSGADDGDKHKATSKDKKASKPTSAAAPTSSEQPATRGCPYAKSSRRRVMDPFSAAFFGVESKEDKEASNDELVDPITELLTAIGVIPQQPARQTRQSRQALAIAQEQAQAQAAAHERARRQAALARRRAAHQAQLEREAALRRQQQEQREAAIRRAQVEREAAIRAAAMERELRFRLAQQRAAQEAAARRIQAEREAAYWAQQERMARQHAAAAAAAQARSRGPCAGAFVPTFVTEDEMPRFVIHPGWSW